MMEVANLNILIFVTSILIIRAVSHAKKAVKARAKANKPLKPWQRTDPQALCLNRKHKWLGGAVARDGTIFGIPSNAEAVITIKPTSGDISVVRAPSLGNGRFKWLRGVYVPNDCNGDGAIYGVPAWSGTVLKIEPKSGKVTQLGDLPAGPWNWHGGALAANQNIYCIPSNSEQVLKINTQTGECSLIGPKLPGKNKYYGGILGDDGCIYGMPYKASAVLKIDPKDDKITTLGSFSKGFGENWHGGLKSPQNSCIYAFPANAESVLCIDPATEIVTELRPDNMSGMKGKYKWLGGCLDKYGNVYAVPSDTTTVLKIKPKSGKVTTFGNVPPTINKWQGGVRGDNGKIYCIPSDADNILVIDPETDELELIGDGIIPKNVKDKWQGGFLVDGIIYAIPENADTLLKLEVATHKIELVNLADVLPDT